ncbi:MAG: DUF4166 domain-containing protein [Gammaproteobacteria bacterium]|nr:DUF4166 domain-containing protein [Gammaproteobacteria bacterium]
MDDNSIIRKALGDQWHALPTVLRAHYQEDDNSDIGALDVEYPWFMQYYLNFLRLFGALVNKRGKEIPTTVEKTLANRVQHWRRTITFPNGKTLIFRSRWVYTGGNELIEYVNPFLGLRMAVKVEDGKLLYSGRSYILKLGSLLIPIPEALVLGHTTIEEVGLDENHFAMDFRLTHPLFGQLFRYAGKFRTESKAQT